MSKWIKVTHEAFIVDVLVDIQHDPGVHTHRNGDPGYPPTTEVELKGYGEFQILAPQIIEMHFKRDVMMVSTGRNISDFIFDHIGTFKIGDKTMHEIIDEALEANIDEIF